VKILFITNLQLVPGRHEVQTVEPGLLQNKSTLSSLFSASSYKTKQYYMLNDFIAIEIHTLTSA